MLQVFALDNRSDPTSLVRARFLMDGFQGKIAGTPYISWENLWFPADFPVNQSIERFISNKWGCIKTHKKPGIFSILPKSRYRFVVVILDVSGRWICMASHLTSCDNVFEKLEEELTCRFMFVFYIDDLGFFHI